MPGEISTVVRQVSGLIVLAGCVYMAAPLPKQEIHILPSVEPDKPAKPKLQKMSLSSEVREFIKLPPHFQRQVLDYARNWIDASFERID